ncbi:MAG: polysaccharide deacetylase family protein [Candidatus Sulfotelmatobacter sp.]
MLNETSNMPEFETKDKVARVLEGTDEIPAYGCFGKFANMETPRIVTTSWDDGDRADLRLAEMLQSRNIGGTFYVPNTPYGERPALTPADLRTLSSEGFEIGAHTVSHKLLWGLTAEELAKEVSPCKPMLEDILGKEVRMFCYSEGRYDSNVIRTLKEAGYWGARTVRMLATRLEFDPFEMPTSVQIVPNRKYGYIKNVARARKLEGLQVFLRNVSRLDNWLELGKSLFDSVLQNGGMMHLYGHSHEIEKLGLWRDLQEMLDYVANRKGVAYVPNCELIRLLPKHRRHAGNGKL